MEQAKEKWIEFIDISFLSDDLKAKYRQLIEDRFTRIIPK